MWVTELFRKKPEPEPKKSYVVLDYFGTVICRAWKPDYETIAYLLTAEPKGRC